MRGHDATVQNSLAKFPKYGNESSSYSWVSIFPACFKWNDTVNLTSPSPNASRPVLRSTPPPIQWVPKALSPAVKASGSGVKHSPKSSVEVRNELSCNSTPPYGFMRCTGTALPSFLDMVRTYWPRNRENVQHTYSAKRAPRKRTEETRTGGHSKALKSKERIKTNVVMIMITASEVKSTTPTPSFQQSKDRDHQGWPDR